MTAPAVSSASSREHVTSSPPVTASANRITALVVGAAFVVLDVALRTYFLMDTAGPDATSPIATNVEGLLDWLWQSRVAPKA